MKSKLIVKLLYALVLITLSSVNIYAQAGKIAGKVTDIKTGETLIGLSVKISGTTKGSITDVEGRYSIPALAPGKYIIDFSYIGYSTKSISDVEVVDGQVTTLNVAMEQPSEGKRLQEVVIKGSAKRESVNTLYAQQKNSIAISDGISADVIRKSPDRNTSEVLKRVSGTTIQDNKFVIIRGLSDRYNTSMLDNAPLPSTEPNRKAFSFDIIPSSLIENIIINKTATPDLPGDFAGGAIQILTREIPDQNFFNFSIGEGYNSNSTGKKFISGERGGLDFLGFDNGDRQLPASFPGTMELAKQSEQQKLNSQLQLKNLFSNRNTTALPSQNIQMAIGKNYRTESSNVYGGIFSVNYRNGFSITNPFRSYNQSFVYNDDQYKYTTSLGLLANFGYSFKNSKISFKNIYNRNFDDLYTVRSGVNAATTRDVNFYAIDLLQKSLFNTEVDGTHKLSDNGARLKWSLSYGNIINNQPDQKKMLYSRPQGSNEPMRADVTGSSIGRENARFYSDLNENIYSTSATFSLPVRLFKEKSTLKFGASGQLRERSFDARLLGSTLRSDNSGSLNDSISKLPIDQLFNSDLVKSGVYRILELTSATDRYDAHAFTGAGYAMLDNKLTKNLRMVWGLRVENFLQSIDNTEVDQSNLDILPSVNFTYSLTEKANLRASYSKTVARPEFRELAPFAYYDYELSALSYGNKNTERTQIDNVDLRYEFYPSPGQIISVSAFFKNFEKPIEPTIFDKNSSLERSYQNASNAKNYGIEAEIRRSLDFIPGFGNNLQAYTNVAVIKSEVRFVSLADGTAGEGLEKRPLAGQSPYVINAGLTYSSSNNKLAFNALYNRIGRRINAVGGTSFPTIWENPRDQIDFQASYKVLKNKGELKLNLADILNQNVTFYQDWNLDKSYTPGKKAYNSFLGYEIGDETIGKYKPGVNASLSFSYRF